MVIMMVLIPGSDFSSLLSQDLLFFLQFQKLLVRKREDMLCCCFMRDTVTPELSAWLEIYDIIPSGYIVYVFSGRSLLLWLFLLLLSSSRGASGSNPGTGRLQLFSQENANMGTSKKNIEEAKSV